MESGHLGDSHPLKDGDGVCELRFKNGIRIYFAKMGSDIVILLCAGDKGSQNGDIEKAKKHWKEARRAYA